MRTRRMRSSSGGSTFVFTDIQMPGSMDGLKLARFIRGTWPPINSSQPLDRWLYKTATCRKAGYLSASLILLQ